jgi:hypothetical protein
LSQIYKLKSNQPVVWFHRDIRKSNRFCLYCGQDFYDATNNRESNKEHLIGREFVPKRSLDNGQDFNLIFRACKECNARKSELERHISSITLVNSSACQDDALALDSAERKANKDYHPDKKGVLIKDSHEKHSISGQLMGMNISFGLTSPPQLKRKYAEELAFRHIQGIFSMITSSNPTQQENTRWLTANHFDVFGIYKESDWGNPQLQEIISRTSDWSCYANINTANGFFKVIMKRDNKKNSGWVWAIEWNKSYRVIGAIGTPDIFNNLPELDWRRVSPTERVRTDTPLNDTQDFLFNASVENI